MQFSTERVLVDPLGRVNRANAAKMLGLTPKTLCNWLSMGRGPRCFLVGGRTFYMAEEVAAFGRGERTSNSQIAAKEQREQPREKRCRLDGVHN